MLSLDKVFDAQTVLKSIIRETNVVKTYGIAPDCDLYLKPENLQITGSFKVRGSAYKISQLSAEEKAKGVIACSAGNHAQGVALAATKNGIKSLICLPDSAPISKVEATKGYGAEVCLVEGVYDDAYNKAIELKEKEGYTFVHPFDDEDVIAGQGTIALEVLNDLDNIDAIVVPVGGGGLISGIAYTAKHIRPSVKVYGVQMTGAPSAIIHFYNSVSVAQREQVFKKSKEEIKKIAVDGAKLVKKLAAEYEGNFRFEYSPESFTGTEPEYALEVCNAVLDVLEPSETNNVIINLPVTVEMSMPHVYASQVEYMSENLKYREFVTLSLHPHNDRGTGVADTELALLAGADRVEGTLFGNGERTGNVDIITLAMNMYSHGVDPKLDFSDMPYLVDEYEKCTRMHVYERAPYAGALVFAAFSGSHQDAIAKGMKYRAKNKLHQWNVPYIPIDPKDIGRTYDADVIRVNSQSGKGGIGYLLEQTYGYNLPPKMREHFSYLCKDISDHEHKELKPDEVLNIFEENYLNLTNGVTVTDFEFMRDKDNVKIGITFAKDGEETEMEAEGNGSLNAINNALRAYTGAEYTLQVFTQHSMQGQGSQSVAASYIGLEKEDGSMFWGAGTDTDVVKANTKALLFLPRRAVRASAAIWAFWQRANAASPQRTATLSAAWVMWTAKCTWLLRTRRQPAR